MALEGRHGVIAYFFLTLGAGGTAAVVYAVAPAGRGLHRYVMPRSKLRAIAAGAEADADMLAAELVSVCDERDLLMAKHEEALALLGKAEQLVTELEEQLRAFDSTCAENTRLRAELANATAVRPLPCPAPAEPAAVAVVSLHKLPLALEPVAQPS